MNPPQDHPDPDDDDNADQAAKAAAAAIYASLDQWTSPKLGTVAASVQQKPATLSSTNIEMDEEDNDDDFVYVYERDPDVWLQQGEDDDEDIMLLEDTTKTPQTLQMHRQPTSNFQRAGTPIMSNVATTTNIATTTTTTRKATTTTMDTTPVAPYNVQSPWSTSYTTTPGSSSMMVLEDDDAGDMDRTTPAASWKNTRITTFIASSSAPQPRRTYSEYRQYHDAVAQFLLPQQHVRSSHHARDINFLSTLNINAWSRPPSAIQEGNVWKLLEIFRTLGPQVVIWNNGQQQQHNADIASYIQQLASSHVNTSPANLVATLYDINNQGTTAPMAWRRRVAIMQWLEQCFAAVLPKNILHPRRTTTVLADVNNKHTTKEAMAFYKTDKDEEVLHACLLLLLAGQFVQAQQLLRDCGMGWRAGLWDGGTPHDVVVIETVDNDDDVPSIQQHRGNPRRALWRRMMWLHATKLKNNNNDTTTTTTLSSSSSQYETAITALLSSNLNVALDCAALRTWERGLYSIWRAVMDRTVDELLHYHNNRRRLQNPPYPGTECQQSELDHLAATTDVVGFSETNVITILDSTPFEEMRSTNNWVLEVTAAILVGKGAIMDIMEGALDRLDAEVDPINDDDLRFLAHLALYFASLASNHPHEAAMDDDAAEKWKNDLVLEYIHHLASQRGLWDMLVLYASFLPPDQIIAELSHLLQMVQSQQDRKVVVKQLRDYLPQPGLDLQVLMTLVHHIMSEVDEDETSTMSRTTSRKRTLPSSLDRRKMKSIQWLFLHEDHEGAALMAANRLLRQFLLAQNDDKRLCATIFVNDILGDFLSAVVTRDALGRSSTTTMHNDDERNNNTEWAIVHADPIQHAKTEHIAFLEFLQAMTAVDTCHTTLAMTQWSFSDWNEFVESSAASHQFNNKVEQSIAASAELRRRVEAIRKASTTVVTAAEATCKSLQAVLEHDGGWLCLPSDDDTNTVSSELELLRCKWLPIVVTKYYDICLGAASWLYQSTENALEALGSDLTPRDVFRHLDEVVPTMTGNDISPIHPRYWTTKALDLAELTVSDLYDNKSAFDSSSFHELSIKLADATVLDQRYATL